MFLVVSISTAVAVEDFLLFDDDEDEVFKKKAIIYCTPKKNAKEERINKIKQILLSISLLHFLFRLYSH